LSLQIRNMGRDAGGFNAVAARREVVFNEVNLGLDEGKFVTEVVQSIVLATVPLDFGGGVPVIEVSDGVAECVIGRGRAIEQSVEPDRERLGDVAR
jgi:hypothetical protein